MKIFSPVLKGTTTVLGGTTNLSGSFTGSLQGTSSFASNADLLDGVHLSVLATTGSNTFNGNQNITGSLIVGTGGITELQVLSTGIKVGNVIGDAHAITGSVGLSGSLTSTGTITAQTLVVQTITSSVDFITGSTRHGSNTTNTHQFTGSLLVSGSSAFTGSITATSVLTLSNVVDLPLPLPYWRDTVGTYEIRYN